MIQRNPIMAARRNPTMVANPRGSRMIHRPRGKDIMHYVKNPGEVRVPGSEIKLIPLAAGAAGAIVITQAFQFIPYLNTLGASNAYVKNTLPGLFTVGASWAIHKYLGPKYAFVKEMSSLMAAVGVVLMVQSLATTANVNIVQSIANTIKKTPALASQTAALPGVTVTTGQAGMSGGGFRTLSGGGFVPALSGGQFNDYQKPFIPVEGTALSGFVMSGGVSSDRPPLGLGARHGASLGGIDLKDFAE